VCGWRDGPVLGTLETFAKAGPTNTLRRIPENQGIYGQELHKGIGVPVRSRRDVRVNGQPVVSGRMVVQGMSHS